jgi:hypothetical protein
MPDLTIDERDAYILKHLCASGFGSMAAKIFLQKLIESNKVDVFYQSITKK